LQNFSIVYKNISLYRFIMNVIYGGSYRARFELITRFVANNKISSVLELCFGDIIIAEYCKQLNINWKGIDINLGFTEYAKKKDTTLHARMCSLLIVFTNQIFASWPAPYTILKITWMTS